MRGEITDLTEFDHCFFYICGLDDHDDWTDERVWPKANPNLGVSITLEYLQEQVKEALAMPSKQGIVRRLNFCEWTEAFSPWISKPVIDKVWAPLKWEDYVDRPCFGGLDLSMARDLTAFSLCFPDPEDTQRHDILTVFWTPGDTLRERSNIDRVPYELWADQGHVVATPGKVVNYQWVADRIIWAMETFDVKGIAFDEYRIQFVENELIERGSTAPFLVHPQGYRRSAISKLWMPESVNALENGIIEERIRMQANPVMAMCAACVVLEADAQGNRKFAKNKSTGRIDGIVSAAMSLGAATQAEIQPPSIYDVIAKQRVANEPVASVRPSPETGEGTTLP
jgi:phage terminase large subunit-like protein